MVGFASLLDDTAMRNLIAYVTSLPDSRPAPSLVGDAGEGRSLYATCAGCHGDSGEGIWTTSAPRLAHMSDWYLERQLKNFRQGIRGGHPQDFYGAQMAMLAGSLKNDRSVANVMAYINTLNLPAPERASTDPAVATRGLAQR